jgi:SAM-dependent methyltransferase
MSEVLTLAAIQCPSCGAAIAAADRSAACPACGTAFIVEDNCITWESRAFDYKAARRSAILRSVFNPVANPYSPIVRAVTKITGRYYQRTLSDAGLARRFRNYYLHGIAIGPQTAVLDHGCGKGRLIGLLTQLGAKVSAQDVSRDRWWSHFPECAFQVVSPEHRHLPWPATTFGVVLDFGVIEYLSESDLEVFAPEMYRILRAGGHWVVWTLNPAGRGAYARQSPYAHAADAVERAGRAAGFEVVSRRYDAVAFRFFPVLLGALKTIWKGNAFDYFSYGGPEGVPDGEKSKYVVIFRKTQTA